MRLSNIKEVYIGKYKNNDYFCLEYNDNTLVFNITKGIEEHNLNISLSNIEYIYKDGYEYQEPLELDEIIKIDLLSNVELINKHTKKNVSSPYLVCISDKHNNKLYIDIILNTTYTRKNHYRLKKYSNTKIRRIYELHKINRIFLKKKIINYCKLLKVIFEFEEEDVV